MSGGFTVNSKSVGAGRVPALLLVAAISRPSCLSLQRLKPVKGRLSRIVAARLKSCPFASRPLLAPDSWLLTSALAAALAFPAPSVYIAVIVITVIARRRWKMGTIGAMPHEESFQIDYSSPQLGSVKIPLRNESLSVFKFLAEAEPHGIGRFEKLDNLGVLRAAHKSAHHSRWEYMVTQMHLVHFFDQGDVAFGFSGRVRLKSGAEISSVSEFLKSLTLPYAYGHLWGTFEAERVWFEILKSQSAVWQTFLKGLPDDDCRNHAERVLKDEDCFSLFKILGLFMLEMERRAKIRQRPELDRQFRLWAEMLRGSFESQPQGSTLDRSLTAYRRIRTLAYTFLDLEFSQAFLKVNPILLFQQLKSEGDQLLSGEVTPVSRILDTLGSALFERLYASPEASALKRCYFDEQWRRVERLISKRGIAYFSKSEDALFQRLRQAKEHDFGEVRLAGLRDPFLRIEMLPNAYVSRTPCQFYTEEKLLKSWSKSARVGYLVSPIPYENREGCMLDAFLQSGASWAERSTAFNCAVRFVRRCYSEWEHVPAGFDFATADAFKTAFVKILEEIFGKRFKFRVEDGTSPLDYPVSVVRAGRTTAAWCRRLRSELKKSELPSDRKWELMCLGAIASGEERGILLVCSANIKVYDDHWREIAEFDGVYLRSLLRSLHLTLVEAKRGIQRTSGQALGQLKEALHRLGFAHESSKFKYGRRAGVAYVRSPCPLAPSKVAQTSYC
jgi:hypothetical protein